MDTSNKKEKFCYCFCICRQDLGSSYSVSYAKRREKRLNILITNFKSLGINSAKGPEILLSASVSYLVLTSF